MTNQEYEAASIAAAGCYDRSEGECKLKQIDEHISQVEKTLASLHLMRREIVNQYNLNKCEHKRKDMGSFMQVTCIDCGKIL
jgi:hypothetical protein